MVHTSAPLVSVIIPTRDRETLLEAALASVVEQQVAGGIEIIVVNDGAPFSASLTQRWNDSMNGSGSIRFIEMNRGRGPAVARNRGMDESTGEYVAFLDDDDLYLPGHLDAGLSVLARDDVDLVYLGSIVSDGRLSASPSSLERFRLKAYPYDHRSLLVANFMHTGSVITKNFRTTSVRFDESLPVCEDWDLWLALTIALKYRVTLVDRVTCVYHQVANMPGLVSNAQRVAPSLFSKARTYIYRKWSSDDPLVQAYRDWMIALERFRDELIASGHRMPNLLFDAVLAYLFQRIRDEQMPAHSEISQFFGSH